MKLLELLRKGLGFAMLSMGISRPAPKPRPAAAKPTDPNTSR